MARPVLLNNIDHAELRIVTRPAAEYGDSVNQVLVFPTEYEELQREYPIFFRRDAEGAFQSVALLGLDRDENLFLGQGVWEARYVPAVLQRGPFMIGFQERREGGELRREPMIHIDLDHPRISRTEGEPLFRPQGGNSPYLDHVASVLRLIHTGMEVSGPMFEAFEALDLIRPLEIRVELDDALSYVIPEIHAIAEDRLAALDGAALERLHRGGYLRAAFMAASSVGNVQRLIALKNRRNGAG